MRKIQILGAGLFAVFAFAASTAASASATEFLISGEPVLAVTLVYVEGELLLENMSNGASVLCSGVFNADIVNATLIELLELLMLTTLELLDENGGTTGANDMVDCIGEKTCEGEENLLTVLGLPWHLDLELMEGAGKLEFLIHFLTAAEAGAPYGEPDYMLKCKTFLGEVEDECLGLTSGILENMPLETPPDVLALFNTEAESEAGTCQIGGAGQGLLEDEGILIYEPNGLALAIS